MMDGDDLVKRLRSPAIVFYEYSADDGAIFSEAADRIEQLGAALRQIAELSDKGSPTVFARDCVFSEIARAALGEKKDG
jgi:hypothetical protein